MMVMQLLTFLPVAYLDLTPLVASTGAYSPLLSLPVGESQINSRLTVMYSLDLKAFVADADAQSIALISAVLLRCPPLPPDAGVFTLVMYPVLLF